MIYLTIDEIVQMLKITNPKIVFCMPTNIDRVHEALEQLGLEIPVFTFDDSPKEGSVDQLLLETENEQHFM